LRDLRRVIPGGRTATDAAKFNSRKRDILIFSYSMCIAKNGLETVERAVRVLSKSSINFL